MNCAQYDLEVFNDRVQELEVVEYIKTIYSGPIISNDTTALNGQEIDIYLPELKIGFEYSGLYLHSDGTTDKAKWHLLAKRQISVESGIKLYTIFETEWIARNNLVRSKIANILGKSDKSIFARKCSIYVVPTKDKNDFLNNNHLQGESLSPLNIGLYYGDELVSLMAIGRPRFSKKYQWELMRFCNLTFTQVPGGFQKLLKHFSEHYMAEGELLLSYSDCRWSYGNVYNKCGFKWSHYSHPNYWYWGHGSTKLIHRASFQKHKLNAKPELKDHFSEEKTELEIMRAGGYNRIFDCGNDVWIYEKLGSV